MAKSKKEQSEAARIWDESPDPNKTQAAQKAAQTTTGKDGHREGVVSDKTGKILKGARHKKARYSVLLDPELKHKITRIWQLQGRKAYEVAEEAIREYIERYEKKHGPIK